MIHSASSLVGDDKTVWSSLKLLDGIDLPAIVDTSVIIIACLPDKLRIQQSVCGLLVVIRCLGHVLIEVGQALLLASRVIASRSFLARVARLQGDQEGAKKKNEQ